MVASAKNNSTINEARPSAHHWKSRTLGGLDPCIPALLKVYHGHCKRKYGRTFKWFEQGYGDMSTYYSRLTALTKAMERGESLAKAPLKKEDIVWTPMIPNDESTRGGFRSTIKDETYGVKMQEGFFPSPAAEVLPKESATCRVVLVEPTEANARKQSNKKWKTFVLILPGLGEADVAERYELAKKFAVERGWSSLILIAPMYGSRSTLNSSRLPTVADHFLQTLAIYEESALLTQYYIESSPKNRVCITGFSFGGGCALGSLSLALSMLRYDDGQRLGGMFYCPTVSWETLPNSSLSDDIQWEALRGEQKSNQQEEQEDGSTVRERAYRILKEMHITNMLQPLWKRRTTPKAAAITHGAMKGDTLVQPKFSEEFSRVLEDGLPSCTDKVYRWYPGGHISACLLRTKYQFELVEETIRNMDKVEPILWT